jgi:hypothetical protein
MKEGVCPITQSMFECSSCKAIGRDGKCPYMKLDDWAEETLTVMKKLAEDRLEKSNRRMVR